MIARRSLVLAVPALASMLSACGGSSSKPAPAATTTTSAPTATTTAAPASASGTRSITGTVVSNRFGENQVTLVLNGKKIQDVRYALPTDRQRSAEINAQAGPLLRDEVLKAQSAQIDVVSGATATSDAFAQSLQDAVQKAHLAS
jgi:uncharacterized protein with FMN-binding domain